MPRSIEKGYSSIHIGAGRVIRRRKQQLKCGNHLSYPPRLCSGDISNDDTAFAFLGVCIGLVLGFLLLLGRTLTLLFLPTGRRCAFLGSPAKGIHKRRLAMINVAHYTNNRRTRGKRLVLYILGCFCHLVDCILRLCTSTHTPTHPPLGIFQALPLVPGATLGPHGIKAQFQRRQFGHVNIDLVLGGVGIVPRNTLSEGRHGLDQFGRPHSKD